MKKTDDYNWAEDAIASYALAIQTQSGIWRTVLQVKAQRIGSKDRGNKGWRIGNQILYPDEEADI